LILQPESTSSHALRRWKGPAKIVQVLSPNSYTVEHNGAKFRMHANNLQKFNIRVDEVRCEFITLAPTSDMFVEVDFGCACGEVSLHALLFTRAMPILARLPLLIRRPVIRDG
jgi:hypothetical protein